MKIVLSVLLGIAVIGCVLFGIAFTSAQGDLDKAETQLAAAQTELAGTQAALSGVQTELAATQDELVSAQGELQTAEDKLANTTFELEETRTELTDTAAQRDKALEKNTAILDDYSSIREQISRKLGFQADSELIFTPDNPAVSAKAIDIAGAFSSDWDEVWRDYQRMYQWVIDNIEYSVDTNLPVLPETPDGALSWMAEYWKLPQETLEDGQGDCEDMTGLLASLMLSYNHQGYDILAVIIHNATDGHVAVAVPVTGYKMTIFDPAGYYYSGQQLGYVQSYDISEAVDQWLANWSAEMPGAVITAAFSSDFYEEFDSTQAFIDWAVNRYDD